MQKRTLWFLAVAALGLTLAAAGCGSSNNTSPSTDGGSDGGTSKVEAGGSDATMDSGGNGDASGDTGGNDANIDAGVLGCTLKGFGQICLVDSECCSQKCDPTTHTCAASVANCHGAGGLCGTGLDCCSLSCIGGQCANKCVADQQPCTSDAQCCGQKCSAAGPIDGGPDGATGMTCTPISTSCSSAGNPCTPPGPDGGANAACCSGLCSAGGTCVLQSSFCIQTNDICINNNDCCTGICSADVGDAGGNIGHCMSPPNSGRNNCSGAADGTLCTDCGSCCSALCAPYITGLNVCQPANGCHVEGDLCRSTADCCSADPNAPDAGDTTGVYCSIAPGDPVGYCTSPNGCRPLGDTCHFKNYTCSNSTKADDCCAIGGPSNKICALDPLGVPRCASGVCTGGGGSCTNSLDCCLPDGGLCYDPDGGPTSGCLPCIPEPDGGGGFVCAKPNDAGTFCRMNAQTCTINADCCASLMCYVPPGSTSGTCGPLSPPPPPPPLSDGGVSDSSIPIDAPTDSFTCALYGQSCAANSDCCNGVPCAIGGSACVAGNTGCTCHYILH